MIAALIAVSAAASALGAWPEARDTWRGLRHPGHPRAAKPVVMSWLVWTAILGIGGTAALYDGQLAAAVFTLAEGAGCVLVAVLAMRIPADRRDEPARMPLPGGRIRLDVLCLPGAAAGLVLLAVARARARRWRSASGRTCWRTCRPWRIPGATRTARRGRPTPGTPSAPPRPWPPCGT